MIRLLDGPAEGTYALKRAPAYGRAVVTDRGETDVLDQLEDIARPGETVSVYRLVTPVSTIHVRMSGRGSGFYPMADYEHMPDVDGEAMRDNAAWREWAQAQP